MFVRCSLVVCEIKNVTMANYTVRAEEVYFQSFIGYLLTNIVESSRVESDFIFGFCGVKGECVEQVCTRTECSPNKFARIQQFKYRILQRRGNVNLLVLSRILCRKRSRPRRERCGSTLHAEETTMLNI